MGRAAARRAGAAAAGGSTRAAGLHPTHPPQASSPLVPRLVQRCPASAVQVLVVLVVVVALLQGASPLRCPLAAAVLLPLPLHIAPPLRRARLAQQDAALPVHKGHSQGEGDDRGAGAGQEGALQQARRARGQAPQVGQQQAGQVVACRRTGGVGEPRVGS